MQISSMSVLVAICVLAQVVPVKAQHNQLTWKSFYPSGKLFPCAAYSSTLSPSLWPKLRDAGILILGPEYENTRSAPYAAAKAGFATISTIDTLVKFSGRNLDLLSKDTLNRSFLEKEMGETSSLKEVIGWYLLPEEIRHWRERELRFFKSATTAVKSSDPLRRPVFTYDPGNRDAKAMVATGRYEDILVRGIYPNYAGYQDKRGYVRWSIDEMRKAQVELSREGHKILLWPALEMFANPPSKNVPIATLVRHDVISVLAGGAQGLVIFSMRQRSGFTDYDEYLRAYIEVFSLVCGNSALGTALVFGKRSDLQEITSVKKQDTTFTMNGEKFYVPAVRGTIVTHNHHAWLIIVNSSNYRRSSRWGDLHLNQAPALLKYDKASKTLVSDLGPLQAEIIKLDCVSPKSCVIPTPNEIKNK